MTSRARQRGARQMMIGDQHRNAERTRSLDALDARHAVVDRDDERRAGGSPPAPRSPASVRSRTGNRLGTRKSTCANPSARKARTRSALPVAPSASKSPITSTRPEPMRRQDPPRAPPRERADRQQPLERQIEIPARRYAARRSTPAAAPGADRASAEPAARRPPADFSRHGARPPRECRRPPTTHGYGAKIAAARGRSR